MQIIDFINNITDLDCDRQLIEILNSRNKQGKNQFWISRKISTRSDMLDPCLGVMLREDLAVLHYMLSDGNYVSNGKVEGLNLDELTEFLIEGDVHHPVPNYQVVSFRDAVCVCVDFIREPDVLSNSIEWEAL